jgi:hypothetical protein
MRRANTARRSSPSTCSASGRTRARSLATRRASPFRRARRTLDPFDTVTAKLDPRDYPFDPSSKGYVIPVGKTRKIPLGFYSDGPTEEFHIDAFEGDAFDTESVPFVPTTRPSLEVALDKQSGRNGEKAYLTVTVNAATPEHVTLIVVRSRLGLIDHVVPILIGTEGHAGKRLAPQRLQSSARRRVRMSSR